MKWRFLFLFEQMRVYEMKVHDISELRSIHNKAILG